MLRRLVLASIALGIAGCHGREPLPYSGFVDEPVSAVATQIAGKVVAIHVKEGDRVKKGDLLAELDSAERQAMVSQAQANLERARTTLDEAEANFRAMLPGVTGAGADVARARATADEAKLDYDRAERLASKGAVASAELDTARTKRLEAEAAVDSLLAAKLQSQGKVNAAAAAVADARAGVHTAQAALDLAHVQLAQTRIVAPFDGSVVWRDLEEGEWAGMGSPVVTVESTAEPWVRLDVEETQFGTLKLGAPATIHVIALGDRTFPGHVIAIGAEGDFAINRDVKRGRPDVRTFLVRVAFDAPPDDLRAGMTADVKLGAGAPAGRPVAGP
jgi:multidrug resistance efflux pump